MFILSAIHGVLQSLGLDVHSPAHLLKQILTFHLFCDVLESKPSSILMATQ